MIKAAQRTSLLAGLVIFALLWTTLMGIGVRTVSPTERQPGAASSAGPISGVGPQITYVDDSQFPQLTVYMAVNDNAGQPILGLRKDDFTLKEDGQPVTVQNFVAAGGQAATVMLVIDRSGSMRDEGKMRGAAQAANTFIERLQSGQDRVGIIAFADNIRLLAALTVVTDADRSALQQVVNGLGPSGGTEFYRAVQKAIQELNGESGRKVVLALTDGLDDSGQRYLNATIRAATDAKVPVYTIGLGRNIDAGGMSQLAQQSGGKYYPSPNAAQLESLYLDIASGLRNEYALTYDSLTRNQDGTLRNLEVEIASADGPLSTEGGYQVGGILASSLNLLLFVPLFGLLLLGLVGLYTLPGRRRRLTATADERVSAPVADSPAVPVEQRHAPTPSVIVAPPSPQQAGMSPAPGIAEGGPALVLQLPLTFAENLVGSAAGSGATVVHPSVLAQHVRIAPSGERYTLEDLSGGRTWVSYSGDVGLLRPVQRNALKDGSLVQVGEVQLVFRQSGASGWLERRYPLSSVGLTLGSASDCAVVLPGLAARQAQIVADGPRWVVADLAGGTFVSFSGDPAQERPVAGRNALKDGSLVRVGSVRLVLRS